MWVFFNVSNKFRMLIRTLSTASYDPVNRLIRHRDKLTTLPLSGSVGGVETAYSRLLRKFEKNTTGRHSWAKSVQAQNSLILCCIAHLVVIAKI